MIGKNFMSGRMYRVIVFVCIFPAMTHAQLFYGWGVKAAFTRSRLAIDDFDNFSTWRSGLNAAIYGEHEFGHYVTVVGQLEYTQKGYIFEQVETNQAGQKIQDVHANTRLDYVSVPLLLKLKYPMPDWIPFITVGPRFDYLFHYQKGEFQFTSVTVADDMADHLESFVLGTSVSCGV
jgi:hypothetical protein